MSVNQYCKSFSELSLCFSGFSDALVGFLVVSERRTCSAVTKTKIEPLSWCTCQQPDHIFVVLSWLHWHAAGFNSDDAQGDSHLCLLLKPPLSL